MFKHNKYTKWYYEIINKAKKENRLKGNIYYEKHHIIPKCVGGIETVLLTAREHFICHLLLPKMTVPPLRYKMAAAIARMIGVCKDHKRVYTSSMYETAKKIMSSSRKGIVFSEDHRKKLAESNKRNARFGNDNSSKRLDVKEKISNFNKSSVRVSKDKEKAFYIKKEELDAYLEMGYKIWGVSSTKGFKWFKSPCETMQMFCNPKDAPNEWVRGRIRNKS
jgi:hypothetical protein